MKCIHKWQDLVEIDCPCQKGDLLFLGPEVGDVGVKSVVQNTIVLVSVVEGRRLGPLLTQSSRVSQTRGGVSGAWLPWQSSPCCSEGRKTIQNILHSNILNKMISFIELFKRNINNKMKVCVNIQFIQIKFKTVQNHSGIKYEDL